jgi:predicted RNase H-like nuclease (RuvC/YqgF family)
MKDIDLDYDDEELTLETFWNYENFPAPSKQETPPPFEDPEEIKKERDELKAKVNELHKENQELKAYIDHLEQHIRKKPKKLDIYDEDF